MKKKIIVITGGSRGIGKAVALKLACDGFYIAILYQNNQAAALETQKEIEASSQREVYTYQVSVTDKSELADCFADIAPKGVIAGIVNSAGIIRDGLLMTTPWKDWHDVVETNLYGTIMVTKTAVPYMKENGGVILNMASVSGLRGEVGQTNYAATKSAICSFTQLLAMELIQSKISVYAIAPGFVETEMLKALSPAVQNKYKNLVPCKRFAQSEEIAEVASMLFGMKTNYMTGSVLPIDGGLSYI